MDEIFLDLHYNTFGTHIFKSNNGLMRYIFKFPLVIRTEYLQVI